MVYCPVLDIFAWDESNIIKGRTILGAGCIQLKEVLTKIFNSSESEQVNFFNIDKNTDSDD